ncbi:hypothetical protein D3C85_1699420 [compost metagenome]
MNVATAVSTAPFKVTANFLAPTALTSATAYFSGLLMFWKAMSAAYEPTTRSPRVASLAPSVPKSTPFALATSR